MGKVWPKGRVFVVAEVSANHAHSLDKAYKLIHIAKKYGADAVKFQTYTPETMTIKADNKHFKIIHPKWGGQSLYQLYEKAYTPWEWFKPLKKEADKIGIIFFSTSFDKSSVDFLEDLDVPMHKIASFEIVDLSLIEYVAKTHKPLILSTGMASLDEIREAVNIAKKSGAKDILLLKCVSSYPAKPEEMNLRSIPWLSSKFNLPVGISDHSLGIGVSLAAVALGAVAVEKHITLSRKIKTVDSFFSIEPDQLQQLVENIRITEKAVGSVRYSLTSEEERNRFFRRSLFVVEDTKKGAVFTEANVRSIRPGIGLKPKYLKQIIGKKASRDIIRGTPLTWKLITQRPSFRI